MGESLRYSGFTGRILLVVWMLLILLPAGLIRAEETGGERKFQIFGQSSTYWEDTDGENSEEDYTKFKQLLAFNLRWSKFTLGVQAEYLDYSDRELANPLDLDRLHDNFEARKYFLDYSSDLLSARLGTFFASFGRGMTLYVQKNESLGLDEPIHGAMGTLRLKHFDITALGGDVTEPILQNQYDRTFSDSVRGGRILARLPRDLYLGASWVDSSLARFYPKGNDDVHLWSIEGGGASIAGFLDLHAEWAEIDRDGAYGSKTGWGKYVSATGYFGPLSLLLEYKDYWNFEYRYNLPPSAGSEVESYTHDDVRGPRLLMTADVASLGAILTGSYAEFDSHERETSAGGRDGDHQTEWYLRLEESLGPVYLETGHFKRRWTDRKIRQEHTNADLHLTVGQRNELIAGYDKRIEAASYFSLATSRSYLAWALSPHGTLSLRYAWEDRSQVGTENFWAAELEYLPTAALVLNVFFGEDPGGLVCAGGQCREEPRFKGLRTSLTWRF